MATETFLLVGASPGTGDRHELGPDTTIGRESCDILVIEEEVSRRHAVIRAVETGLAIEDLRSRNGTFVNGERVEGPFTLTDGDTIQIGATRWRFQVSREVETAFFQEPPAPSGPGGMRGDVPPPELVPSVVRNAPRPQASSPPAFPSSARRRIRSSAARRGGAVLASYAVVLATAVAVIAYFAAR